MNPLPKEVLKCQAAAGAVARWSLVLMKSASLASLPGFRRAPLGELVICKVISAWANWRTKAIVQIIQARAWLSLSSVITCRACFFQSVSNGPF